MLVAKLHVKRIHEGGGESVRTTIALCDAALLGKRFEEGELELDLKKYRSFYEGEEVTQERAIELLREAHNANVVGEESVNAAKKAFKIPEANVKRINGIPHVQVYRV